ncbi:MAG: hypothetical protein LBI71_05545 [Enterobacteriaceae bacterium]|jgi:hypothetical protein|nr:hypothetical protein [Enterobacteriaceae bacterium]
MEKFLAATSTFIEKATDTRYFLLFASFLIVTDTVLCKTINTPLLQFTYSDVTNKLHLGAVLAYMSFFLFYTSVLIPFIAYILGLILIHLPSWVTSIFPDVNEDKHRYPNYILIDRLRDEAVEENNSVKFNLYIKRENKNNDEAHLYKLSFTFLFTLILSFLINFNNHESMLNTIFNYIFSLGDFMRGIIFIIISVFSIYCMGLGIGGYCLKRYTENYIYIGNKNIKAG